MNTQNAGAQQSAVTILGSAVQDLVTGFKGIAMGRVEYLSGCNQVLVQPTVGDDGAFKESHWIDEQRLQVLEIPRVVLDNGANPGPDKPAPKI